MPPPKTGHLKTTKSCAAYSPSLDLSSRCASGTSLGRCTNALRLQSHCPGQPVLRGLPADLLPVCQRIVCETLSRMPHKRTLCMVSCYLRRQGAPVQADWREPRQRHWPVHAAVPAVRPCSVLRRGRQTGRHGRRPGSAANAHMHACNSHLVFCVTRHAASARGHCTADLERRESPHSGHRCTHSMHSTVQPVIV